MRPAFLAAGLLLAASRAASAQAVIQAPLRAGEVTFAMRATKVNDFIGHAAVSRAEFHGDQLAHVTGFVEVRLTEMHTGIGLRDTHMRNAMRADSFPVIRFDLESVETGSAQRDSVPTVFAGRMTIHGVTRAVRLPGFVILAPGRTDVSASFPLDMREYGIEPPVRFLGAIRVNPVTTVGVSLSFAQ